jgi:hypothetical protein
MAAKDKTTVRAEVLEAKKSGRNMNRDENLYDVCQNDTNKE